MAAGDRVEGAVALKLVFSQSPDQAMQLLAAAKGVLTTWQSSYLQVKAPRLQCAPRASPAPTVLAARAALRECL